MVNKFGLLVVKGLLTILPFVLTIYFIAWLAMSAEAFISPHIPYEYYFPGLGVVIIILLLALIGLLVNALLIKQLVKYANHLLERLPVVKTIFGAIQDAVELFQVKKEQGSKKAVSVEVKEGICLIGFVTSDKASKMLFPDEDKVAVYMPLSYQIGGYTIYIDKTKIRELDIDVETAMRIAVTGGNSLQEKPVKVA